MSSSDSSHLSSLRCGRERPSGRKQKLGMASRETTPPPFIGPPAAQGSALTRQEEGSELKGKNHRGMPIKVAYCISVSKCMGKFLHMHIRTHTMLHTQDPYPKLLFLGSEVGETLHTFAVGFSRTCHPRPGAAHGEKLAAVAQHISFLPPLMCINSYPRTA